MPQVIRAIDVTTAGGPRPVDLLTSADVLTAGNHTDVQHPLGQVMLLAERITLTPAFPDCMFLGTAR